MYGYNGNEGPLSLYDLAYLPVLDWMPVLVSFAARELATHFDAIESGMSMGSLIRFAGCHYSFVYFCCRNDRSGNRTLEEGMLGSSVISVFVLLIGLFYSFPSDAFHFIRGLYADSVSAASSFPSDLYTRALSAAALIIPGFESLSYIPAAALLVACAIVVCFVVYWLLFPAICAAIFLSSVADIVGDLSGGSLLVDQAQADYSIFLSRPIVRWSTIACHFFLAASAAVGLCIMSLDLKDGLCGNREMTREGLFAPSSFIRSFVISAARIFGAPARAVRAVFLKLNYRQWLANFLDVCVKLLFNPRTNLSIAIILILTAHVQLLLYPHHKNAGGSNDAPVSIFYLPGWAPFFVSIFMGIPTILQAAGERVYARTTLRNPLAILDEPLFAFFSVIAQIFIWNGINYAFILPARVQEGADPTQAAEMERVANAAGAMMARPLRCPHCGFGPVDIHGCDNLQTHHGERGANNACPNCGWRGRTVGEWLPWRATEIPLVDDDIYRAELRKRLSAGVVFEVRSAMKGTMWPCLIMVLGRALSLSPITAVSIVLCYLAAWTWFSMEGPASGLSVTALEAVRAAARERRANAIIPQPPAAQQDANQPAEQQGGNGLRHRNGQQHGAENRDGHAVQPGGGGGAAARPVIDVPPDDGSNCPGMARRPLQALTSPFSGLRAILEARPRRIFLPSLCATCLDNFPADAAADVAATDAQDAAAQAALLGRLRSMEVPLAALPCGHVMHEACCIELVQQNYSGLRPLNCPTCMASVTLLGTMTAQAFA